MKLYKQELLVATQAVTITKGTTATSNIVSTEVITTPIFRIGEFDGQPFEFKNGDKFLGMYVKNRPSYLVLLDPSQN